MTTEWRLENRTRGTVLVERLEVADGFWSRLRGLLGRAALPAESGLLLVPCRSVHTFGLGFPIDVIFLDGAGQVVEVRREVGPYRVGLGPADAHAVLEVPAGKAATAVGERLRIAAPADATVPAAVAFLTDRGASVPVAVPAWPFLLVLWLVVGFAYFNSLAGAFVGDDRIHIVENPAIRRAWPTFSDLARGRPLLTLSLAWNYALGGLDPRGYHLFNLVVHLLATATLFGLVRRVYAFGRPERTREAAGIAFAAAMLWGLHPLQTQAVTYVVQRCESLASLFYLLCLYGVVRGAEAANGRGIFWGLVSVAACALGLATKEIVITAPVAAVLLDVTCLGGSVRRRWPLYASLCAAWIVLALPMLTTYKYDAAGFGQPGVSAGAYALTQCGAIVHYLRLTFWPDRLVFDYFDWPLANSPAAVVPALLLVLALAGLTVVALVKWPRLGFLGAAFFIVLAPSSSVVPIVDLVVEHRMYLALAPLAVLVVLAVRALPGIQDKPAVLGALLGCVVVLLAGRTILRNHDYRSEVALWTDTVEARPGNQRAHVQLGAALVRVGRFEDARGPLETGANLAGRASNPLRLSALANLAVADMRTGRFREAADLFAEVTQRDPDNVAALAGRGFCLWALGEKKEAAATIQEAVDRDPELPAYRFQLAFLLGEIGNAQAAAEDLRAALQREPDWPRTAARQAWEMATRPDDRARAGNEAVFLALTARNAAPEDPEVLDALAAAYAETGRFSEAVRTAKAAADKARAAGRADLAAAIDQRLALYEAGQPFRTAGKEG